jgi:hypothetical protein
MGSICGLRPAADTSVIVTEEKNLAVDINKEDVKITDPLREKFNFDSSQSKSLLNLLNSARNDNEKSSKAFQLLERIKVQDKNYKDLGSYITVKEMKKLIHPDVLKIKEKMKDYEPSKADKETLEQILETRSPFKYKLDDSIFHGSWNSKGLREGYGVHVKKTGEVLEGLWRDGKILNGRIYYLNSFYYEGEIKENQPDGKGKKVGPNGEEYRGHWKADMQQEFGERKYPDNLKIEGKFVDNFLHGNGSAKWSDGSHFEGEFIQSTIKGKGTFTIADGEYYQGSWNFNLPNGKGEYFFKDGQKYNGDYVNGRREGTGRYDFNREHNTFYTGSFKDGLPHGSGEYKLKKTSYKGLWRYGRLINDSINLNSDIILDLHKENFKFGNSLKYLNNNLHSSQSSVEQKFNGNIEHPSYSAMSTNRENGGPTNRKISEDNHNKKSQILKPKDDYYFNMILNA